MVQRPSGSRWRCQIATSVSVRVAHEFGGGDGGTCPSTSPAMTVSVTPGPGCSRGIGLGPQHREVRVDELVLGGQVQPDLEQLERVRRVALDQREGLGVHDARACGQPLHVAPSEPGRRPERVRVVDQAPPDERDGLEATVRVLGKPRDLLPVVHAPPVDALEVLAHLSTLERRVRSQHLVAGRIGVVVVHAEQERVDRGPLEPDRHGLEDGARHGGQTTGMDGTRVDAWLWAVRLFRTRSAAAAACRAGHVRVNGRPAKPATSVVVGDQVRARVGERERLVEVARLISTRVGAPIAVECYADHSPAPEPADTIRTRRTSRAGQPVGPPSGSDETSTGCGGTAADGP